MEIIKFKTGEGNLIKCCQKFNKRLNQNEVAKTKNDLSTSHVQTLSNKNI